MRFQFDSPNGEYTFGEVYLIFALHKKSCR